MQEYSNEANKAIYSRRDDFQGFSFFCPKLTLFFWNEHANLKLNFKTLPRLFKAVA